jgi:hypothetical protein
MVPDIKVLGTNSKQYLIVRLPTKKPETDNSAVSAAGGSSPLLDGRVW